MPKSDNIQMKNCLRYLMNDYLYVEATLENDKYQETFKTLTVRLCVKGEHLIVGEIKFLWPEQCLPNEIVFRIQSIKRSLHIGTSEDSVPSVSVHTSLSSVNITEPFDSLVAKISNCLAQKDLSNIWNDQEANVGLSDQLPVALPAQMQMALLKILRKCVSEKLFNRILTFIIHSRLITESKACCKFIELLASKSLIQKSLWLIQQAVDLLRFSLIVDDRTYMMFLKMCSNDWLMYSLCTDHHGLYKKLTVIFFKSVSESSNLLSALLKKPVNSWELRLTVSQELTEIEDEKCHGAIRDAACFAATMILACIF
uniref:Uncharacterized protein n=1 Tax=Wuchereria bancrofti TaxID=6293 RepID=A0A1I8EED5_WUCBA